MGESYYLAEKEVPIHIQSLSFNDNPIDQVQLQNQLVLFLDSK